MSTSVEQRIVEMKFDNAGFAKGVEQTIDDLDKLDKATTFDGGKKGLKQLQVAADQVNFNHLVDEVHSISESLNRMQSFGFQVFENLTQRAIDWGANMVKSLSIDQIGGGFHEYELKMDSVRTIMSSSGADIDTVNKYLQELNEYSDKTIYSFSDMTSSIGKFTNAGVDLDKAVTAIQGISNEAALSGANANDASRAMYNFAQALSSGSVKLIDWKSIETANMATVEFKEELLKTALALGTVVEKEGGYVTTTTNAQGKVSDLFTSTTGFNESLNNQWMTTDVLVETLSRYADETTEVGARAFDAAQEVTTYTKMMDSLKEAVGSGWATTFEILFGDLEHAKILWTNVNEVISGIIQGISDTRNGILELWKAAGGHTAMLDGLKNVFYIFRDITSYIGLALETLFGHRYLQNFEETAKFFSDRKGFAGNLVTIKRISDFLISLSVRFRDLTAMVREKFNPEIESSRHFLEEIYQCTQAILIPARFIFRIVSGIASKVLPPLVKAVAGAARLVIFLISRIGYTLTEGGLQMKLYALADDIVNVVGGAIDFVTGVLKKSIGIVDKLVKSGAFAKFGIVGNGIGQAVGAGFQKAIITISNFISIAYGKLKAFGEEVAKGLGFKDLNAAIKQLGTYLTKKLVKAIELTLKGFTNLKKTLKSLHKTMKPIVSFLTEKFLGTLTEIKKFLSTNGTIKKIKKSVDDFFKSFDKAKDAADDVASVKDQIKEFVKQGLSLEEAKKKVANISGAFKDWGGFVDYVKDKFDKLVQTITKSKPVEAILKGISDLETKIKNTQIYKVLSGIVSNIKENIVESDIFKTIQDKFGGLIEMIQTAISNSSFGDVIDKVKNAFHGFTEDVSSLDTTSLTDFFWGIVDAAKELIRNINQIRTDILETVVNKIKEIYGALFPEQVMDEKAEAGSLFEKVKTVITGGLLGLVEGIRGFNWDYVIDIFRAGLSIYFLGTLAKLLKNFHKSTNLFGVIINSFSNILSNFAKSVKAAKYQILAQALFKAAEGIALIAASLILLSLVPEEKLQAAVGALGAILLLLLLIVAVKGVLAKMGKKDDDGAGEAAEKLSETGKNLVETIKEFGETLNMSIKSFLKNASTTMLIASLTTAVAILAGVVMKLGGMKWEQIWQGLFSLGMILVTLVGFLALIKEYIAVSGGEKSFMKISGLITAMAIGVNRLAKACLDLAGMQDFETGFNRLVQLIGLLGLAVAGLGLVVKYLIQDTELVQISVLIGVLALAILVLTPALIGLAAVPTERLLGVILALAGLVAVVGLFGMIADVMSKASVSFKELGIAILALVGLAAGLLIFAAAITVLALAAPLLEAHATTIIAAIAGFCLVFAVFIGLAWIGQKALIGLGTGLLMISGAVALFGLGLFLVAAACATFANSLDAMIKNVIGHEDDATKAIGVVMYAIIKGIVDGLGYAIAAFVAGVDDTVIALREHLPSALENLTALLLESIAAIFGGIIDAIIDGVKWIAKTIKNFGKAEGAEGVDAVAEGIREEKDKELIPAAEDARKSMDDVLNEPTTTDLSSTGSNLGNVTKLLKSYVPEYSDASDELGDAAVSGFDKNPELQGYTGEMEDTLSAFNLKSKNLVEGGGPDFASYANGWSEATATEGDGVVAATENTVGLQEQSLFGLDYEGAAKDGNLSYEEALKAYSSGPVGSTEDMTDDILGTLKATDTPAAGKKNDEDYADSIEKNGYLVENASKSVAADGANAAGRVGGPLAKSNMYYFVQGAADGIEENADIFYKACAKLMEGGLDTMNQTAEIRSPSRKTMESGYYLVAGAAKGVINNSKMLFDAMFGMSDNMLGILSGAMSTVPEILESDSWNVNPKVTPVLDSTMAIGGLRSFNDILSGTTSATMGLTTTNKIDVGDAVNQLSGITDRNNQDVLRALDKNTAMTSRLIDILQNQKIYLDGKTCVGGMVNEIDRQLGRKQILAGRRGNG